MPLVVIIMGRRALGYSIPRPKKRKKVELRAKKVNLGNFVVDIMHLFRYNVPNIERWGKYSHLESL